MLEAIKTAGKYTQYVGLGLIFTMAVVGTIAIDLVIIAALLKESNRSSNRDNPFVTFMLWNMMFNNSSSRGHNNIGLELLLAPVTTMIAIVLSVFLGVPQIGVALIAGWVVALGVLAVGYAIEQAADCAIEYFNSVSNSNTTTPRCSNDINTPAPGANRTFENNGLEQYSERVFVPVSKGPNMIDYYMEQNQHGLFQPNIPMAEAHLIPEPSAPSKESIFHG